MVEWEDDRQEDKPRPKSYHMKNESSLSWKITKGLDDFFNFSLDVCATQYNSICANFYDKQVDGLKAKWGTEMCWCFPPPYFTNAWLDKAIESAMSGAYVVFCCRASTHAPRFSRIVKCADEIVFLKGKITFNFEKYNREEPYMLVVFKPGAKVKEPAFSVWDWANTPFHRRHVVGSKGVEKPPKMGCLARGK